MEVLLRDAVHKLGNRGEVVKVAPGYARNFLFPKKLAVPVSDGNVRQLAMEKRNYEKRVLAGKTVAEEAKAALEELTLTAFKRAGETNQLFGSVTTAEVATMLKDKGFEVERRKIEMPHIKELGVYPVEVRLHPEVKAEFHLEVKPQQ